MARCLRCGAGNEWIEGDVKAEPIDSDQLRDALDALRALYDEQNGPPLLAPRHRKAWEEAMRRAGEILKKHGV